MRYTYKKLYGVGSLQLYKTDQWITSENGAYIYWNSLRGYFLYFIKRIQILKYEKIGPWTLGEKFWEG